MFQIDFGLCNGYCNQCRNSKKMRGLVLAPARSNVRINQPNH